MKNTNEELKELKENELEEVNGGSEIICRDTFEGCEPLNGEPHLPAEELKPSEYNGMV